MVETFFKSIKAELIWPIGGKQDAKPKGLYSSISTDFITRAAVIHRWAAKAPWPLNERLHK
jgi:hypothetical protein